MYYMYVKCTITTCSVGKKFCVLSVKKSPTYLPNLPTPRQATTNKFWSCPRCSPEFVGAFAFSLFLEYPLGIS